MISATGAGPGVLDGAVVPTPAPVRVPRDHRRDMAAHCGSVGGAPRGASDHSDAAEEHRTAIVGGLPDSNSDEIFADFVRVNTPALIRSACALTGSALAAEELVQDTLVRLYPQWEGKVQNADVPMAYVRRTLANQFLNHRRRAGNREVLIDTIEDRCTERTAESDTVDRDEVRALLATLNLRQRTVLVLRFYEGLNDAEIAEYLGSRPGTVRSLASRGLAALRRAATPGLDAGNGKRPVPPTPAQPLDNRRPSGPFA